MNPDCSPDCDEERELERIMDAIDRFNQLDDREEFDEHEYSLLLERYDQLRRAGYGPQPYPLGE